MNEERQKLGIFPYLVGAISFIPGLGIIFGLIAVTWGLATSKLGGKKLALIGGSGLGFNVLLYGALFYFGFVQRGGIYDDLRVQLSKVLLTNLVQAIEFYNTQNGHYPDSLEVLQRSLPEYSSVTIFDPADVSIANQPRYYHYELVDDSHYYLLGVGLDEHPYTNDDVLPEIIEGGEIGLLIHDGSKNEAR